ncbi:MAG: hypothetical protein NC123_07880 [Butyrivibrio sp.]|nr:hypothetical protein [Acetatifactor muris]MCM1559451.1 hypothetical protein [Butyrivibrio sp.]
MNIIASRSSAGVNRYGLRNTDGTSAGQISVARKTAEERAAARAKARAEQRAKEAKRAREAKRAKEAQKKQLLKKKLHYNFKQISTRILRAKTSGNARRAVTSARQKVVELRKKLKMSDYDNQDLLNAIRHAEAMTRVAKKKLKHLEEEENVKLRGGVCEAELTEETEEAAEEDWYSEVSEEESGAVSAPELNMEDLQELMEIYQELMEEAMEDMESMSELEDLMLGGAGGEMDPEDLEQMKKKHRSEELRKIMEADMKYLKAMFEKLAKEQQSSAGSIGSGSSDNNAGGSAGYDTGGVSLELGGVDIPVDTQMVDAVELVEGGVIDASV